MPLYEYECSQCHRRLEKIQKFSDAELTVCPHCGGRLERTLTAPNVQFKGGGWYKDLYSSAKPSASSGEPGAPAAAAEPGAGSSAKADSSQAGSGGTAPAPSSAAAASTPSSAPAPAAGNGAKS